MSSDWNTCNVIHRSVPTLQRFWFIFWTKLLCLVKPKFWHFDAWYRFPVLSPDLIKFLCYNMPFTSQKIEHCIAKRSIMPISLRQNRSTVLAINIISNVCISQKRWILKHPQGFHIIVMPWRFISSVFDLQVALSGGVIMIKICISSLSFAYQRRYLCSIYKKNFSDLKEQYWPTFTFVSICMFYVRFMYFFLLPFYLKIYEKKNNLIRDPLHS